MDYRIQTTIFPGCVTLEVQIELEGEWSSVTEIHEIAPGVWTAFRDTVKSVEDETLDGFCETLARRFLKQNEPIASAVTNQIQLL